MDNTGFHSLDYTHHSFLWEYDLIVVIILFKISPGSSTGSWSDFRKITQPHGLLFSPKERETAGWHAP